MSYIDQRLPIHDFVAFTGLSQLTTIRSDRERLWASFNELKTPKKRAPRVSGESPTKRQSKSDKSMLDTATRAILASGLPPEAQQLLLQTLMKGK